MREAIREVIRAHQGQSERLGIESLRVSSGHQGQSERLGIESIESLRVSSGSPICSSFCAIQHARWLLVRSKAANLVRSALLSASRRANAS